MRFIACFNTFINILFPPKNDTHPCNKCLYYIENTKKCELAVYYDPKIDKTRYMSAKYVRINELHCGRNGRYYTPIKLQK